MHKQEFPPLLPLGFHEKTLNELRHLCVSSFGSKSTTRGAIMDGLTKVVTELLELGIEAKIWIDGSFATQKNDPSDVDILVEVSGEFYDAATAQQRQLLDGLNDNIYKKTLKVDSRTWNVFDDKGHPDYWDSIWMQAYWLKVFGFYRDDGPNVHETKGIPILTLPGCDK